MSLSRQSLRGWFLASVVATLACGGPSVVIDRVLTIRQIYSENRVRLFLARPIANTPNQTRRLFMGRSMDRHAPAEQAQRRRGSWAAQRGSA
jgi:hypothetical protein